jgi:hypothetical protein
LWLVVQSASSAQPPTTEAASSIMSVAHPGQAVDVRDANKWSRPTTWHFSHPESESSESDDGFDDDY